jgi:hypothetical protein
MNSFQKLHTKKFQSAIYTGDTYANDSFWWTELEHLPRPNFFLFAATGGTSSFSAVSQGFGDARFSCGSLLFFS